MAEGTGDSFSSFPSDLLGSFQTFLDPAEAGFFPDLQSIGNASFGIDGLAYLEILEQPKQRGFRFRYPCEGPSHGGLPGEHSQKGRKSYPSVQINNYVGRARIEVTLVTDTDPPHPHAHSLVGKNVQDGAYVVEVDEEQGMTATFPNLGIQHVTKKKVKDVLLERYIKQQKLQAMTLSAITKVEGDQMDCEASTSGTQTSFDKVLAQTVADEERKKMKQTVEEQAKNMNLSAVRLCFQTYLPDEQGRFVKCLHPVYSQQIYDSKAAAASELKICRMDRQAGVVSGGDEVFLLCDKVQKEDIEVRFFGVNNGREWEDFGKFSTSDVHRQFAIVFKTPAYWNSAIERPVTVKLELRRKTDKETSNAMDFIYKPTEFDPEQIGAKRRKKAPHFDDYSDQGGGGSGMSGAGGGGGPGGFPFLDPNAVSQFLAMYQAGGSYFTGGAAGPTESAAGPTGNGDSSAGISSGSGPSTGTGHGTSGTAAGSTGNGDRSGGVGSLPGSGPSTSTGNSTSGTAAYPTGNGTRSGDVGSSSSISASSGGDVHSRTTHPGINADHGTHSMIGIFDGTTHPNNTGSHVAGNQSAGQTKESEPVKICEFSKNDQLLHFICLHQATVTMKSLQHFSQTNDLRYILAAQRHQTTLPNHDGDSVLHISIINGHCNIVNNILNMSIDEAIINQYNKLRQTPLHLAVITKQPLLIGKLLEAGADVTLQDRHGNTPLHIASQQNDPECLRALVSRESPRMLTSESNVFPGVDLQNYDGLTAVHLAVIQNRLENLKILNLICANMNSMDGKSGSSPLHHAVETYNLTLTGYLILTANVDINITSVDGNTALHVSSGLGLENITALLVAAGAVINIANNDDQTPVDMATTSEVLEVLEGTVGTSLISTTSTRMSNISIHNQDRLVDNNNDNLEVLNSVERNELEYIISSDWRNLAENLNLTYYLTSLALQKNPAKHLLDVYQTVDGSSQRLRNALVELGNTKAVRILDKCLVNISENSRNSKNLFKESGYSSFDSAYCSMTSSGHSFPSLRDNQKGPCTTYDILEEAVEPY